MKLKKSVLLMLSVYNREVFKISDPHTTRHHQVLFQLQEMIRKQK